MSLRVDDVQLLFVSAALGHSGDFCRARSTRSTPRCIDDGLPRARFRRGFSTGLPARPPQVNSSSRHLLTGWHSTGRFPTGWHFP
jgi:hypothetical protein